MSFLLAGNKLACVQQSAPLRKNDFFLGEWTAVHRLGIYPLNLKIFA